MSVHCDKTLSLLKFFLIFLFRDRVSLYSPGCPGTHSVDQAGLELRNLPASASQVLGLKACTATARLFFFQRFIYLVYVSKYPVAVFRHSRRRRQISLKIVVSHHAVGVSGDHK